MLLSYRSDTLSVVDNFVVTLGLAVGLALGVGTKIVIIGVVPRQRWAGRLSQNRRTLLWPGGVGWSM